MRPAYIPLLVLMAAVPALAADAPVDSRHLETLHGTQIYMLNANEGVPGEIWARGDYWRLELTTGGRTVITIQRHDTLYTYEKGSRFGTKEQLGAEVSSMGFIRQIEFIKSEGKKLQTIELEGEKYDQYRWASQSEPELMVVAYLSPRSSLPRAWYYTTKAGEKKAELHRLLYRDMEANVNTPDELFRIPDGVAFTDGSPSDPGKPEGGGETEQR